MSDSTGSHDVVRRWLADRGCPETVVHGGLEGLVDTWETIVASLEEGYAFGLDDYLNDMDLRDTLAGALAVSTPEARGRVQSRVHQIDGRFRSATVAGPCLWGTDVEEDDGLDREREWWYYLRPAVLNEELRDELIAWGLLDQTTTKDNATSGNQE